MRLLELSKQIQIFKKKSPKRCLPDKTPRAIQQSKNLLKAFNSKVPNSQYQPLSVYHSTTGGFYNTVEETRPRQMGKPAKIPDLPLKTERTRNLMSVSQSQQFSSLKQHGKENNTSHLYKQPLTTRAFGHKKSQHLSSNAILHSLKMRSSVDNLLQLKDVKRK